MAYLNFIISEVRTGLFPPPEIAGCFPPKCTAAAIRIHLQLRVVLGTVFCTYTQQHRSPAGGLASISTGKACTHTGACSLLEMLCSHLAHMQKGRQGQQWHSPAFFSPDLEVHIWRTAQSLASPLRWSKISMPASPTCISGYNGMQVSWHCRLQFYFRNWQKTNSPSDVCKITVLL